MNNNPWIVVKVGGSLFDLPDLRDRLNAWLDRIDDARILLVPGGGAAAESIRELDGIHSLGEEAANWLAIRAMSLNAYFLQTLLPDATIVADPHGADNGKGQYILDALPFFQADDQRSDHLPHVWQVTSDSLAARAAILLNARELILLKSTTWPGNDWAEASRAGVVDGYFANVADGVRVRIVNFRA